MFGWMRERRNQPTAQLSGGEQQTVAIGRALVANPRVLLLDELSLGLAPVIVQRIYGMLPQILATGLTVLLVEQDVSQALRVASHIHCLLEGRTTLEGRPADVTADQVEAAYFGLAGAAPASPPGEGSEAVVAWVNAIIQGVLIGGLYALFACGLSLMFGVMKVVNLAHGDLAVVAGYIAIGVIAVTHIPVLWSFLIVVPLMAVLGYVLQRTILQGALDRSVLTTLMVTFGLSVVIENGLLQFFTANSRGIGAGLALVTGSFTHRLADPDRLPARAHLRRRRGGAARAAVLPLPVQVRPPDPRRGRRQGGGAAGRGRLPARVRHRGGDRVRHRGAGRHRLRHVLPARPRPRAPTRSCCSRSRPW